MVNLKNEAYTRISKSNDDLGTISSTEKQSNWWRKAKRIYLLEFRLDKNKKNPR